MLKGKKFFHVVLGLVFISVSIKYFIANDYLWGIIFSIAGVVFLASLILNKNKR